MKSVAILFCLCLTLSVKADISTIPRHDLQDIKYLFKRLIDAHDFAYTIFGSKPMSLADMCLEIPSNLSLFKQIKAKVLLNKSHRCLKAWDKNKNEFEFKNFILLEKEEDLFDCRVVVLINKKNVLEILHLHESIFKEKLGDSFTPELFLKKLEKQEVSLSQAIHNNDLLLGLMLGYGERNAILFQERFDLLKEIGKRKREHLPQDNELNRKLSSVEAQLSDFSEYEENPVLPPLYFLADVSHPETLELKQRYENDRKKIEAMMKKPGFMDKVLSRLVE